MTLGKENLFWNSRDAFHNSESKWSTPAMYAYFVHPLSNCIPLLVCFKYIGREWIYWKWNERKSLTFASSLMFEVSYQALYMVAVLESTWSFIFCFLFLRKGYSPEHLFWVTLFLLTSGILRWTPRLDASDAQNGECALESLEGGGWMKNRRGHDCSQIW